jgi:RNA polymerase sigma-70 factor, ECF subfamily
MREDVYHPGNRDDFDRLYRNTYTRIRFTLQGMLRQEAAAEDCAQEAFERAFRAWSSWSGDAPAEAWLHRIAINVAVSYRRRERLREVGETIRRLGRRGDQPGPEGRWEVLDALRRLPAREAALVVLRYSHGYSNREMAVALGLPESTVSSRLAAARRHLFEMLGEPVIVALRDQPR